MNILFVYPDPKKQYSEKSNKITTALDIAYKYNLTYLTLASLTPKEHSIAIIDDSCEKIDFDGSYDLVGISSMTTNVARAYEIADIFRKKGKKVILGGWHPSAISKESKQHADSVVIGEGENIWPKLLQDAGNGMLKPFYKQNRIVDLGLIPPLIEERNLIKNRRKLITVEATRGCTVGCSFCSCTNKPYYRVFRKRPIENVIEEITHIPTKFFTFIDSSFTLDPEYSKQLLTRLKDLNKKCATNAIINTLDSDDKLLKLSAEAGMTMYSFGLETMSQNTLNIVGKKTYETSKYKSIIKKIHDYGIGVFGYFMFGFDTDTPSVFRNTLDFIYDIELDNAGFCILTPFPGTPLFNKLEKEDRLFTKNWSDYWEGNVVFKPKNMTAEQLLEGNREISKEFYSPLQIVKREIKSLILGLGVFYMETAGSYLYYRWARQY